MEERSSAQAPGWGHAVRSQRTVLAMSLLSPSLMHKRSGRQSWHGGTGRTEIISILYLGRVGLPKGWC